MDKSKALIEQGGRCAYCTGPIEIGGGDPHRFATWDEIVPQSRGGRTDRSNRVLACLPCNQRKGSRKLADFVRGLRPTPTTLPHVGEVWHGATSKFDRFGPGGEKTSDAHEGSHCFSDNEVVARSYAVGFSYQKGERRLIKARVELRDPLIVDAGGRGWTNVNDGNFGGRIPNPAFRAGPDGITDPSGEKMFIVEPRGDVPFQTVPDLAWRAYLQGYDGLIVHNVRDGGDTHDAAANATVATTWIAFDAAAISILHSEPA